MQYRGRSDRYSRSRKPSQGNGSNCRSQRHKALQLSARKQTVDSFLSLFIGGLEHPVAGHHDIENGYDHIEDRTEEVAVHSHTDRNGGNDRDCRSLSQSIKYTCQRSHQSGFDCADVLAFNWQSVCTLLLKRAYQPHDDGAAVIPGCIKEFHVSLARIHKFFLIITIQPLQHRSQTAQHTGCLQTLVAQRCFSKQMPEKKAFI